ncbi:MAG: FdtA/QdtA family cupin domain-containing protein [Chitinispirillaceae bacterium]|nr:FdtA/QdtA family cupin domain-containing protein [Chitinispirillaceae bacterium]
MEEIIVRNCAWITIPRIKDGFDGVISVVEEARAIPFSIRRVYYIYNLMNHDRVLRGKHAHKKLRQVLFCINGSCDIILNDGKNVQVVELCEPHIGLYVGNRLWHVMHNFRNNCILLVFASEYFKESDYIRDFDAFLKYVSSPRRTAGKTARTKRGAG